MYFTGILFREDVDVKTKEYKLQRIKTQDRKKEKSTQIDTQKTYGFKRSTYNFNTKWFGNL